MKQHIITGAIAVVVGLIVAYFTYTLNKEVLDVRFTLSEKIPTKFVDAQAVENVQQLIVRNIGNSSVSKIQIKIKRNVGKADILKNSLNDTITEKISNDYFEAIYPELPPKGSFTYSFKTLADGISKNDLDIRHSKGEVIDALSSRSKTITGMLTNAIGIVVVIFYTSMAIITLMVSFLESKARYEKYDVFLKRKKPFYVSQNKWNKIRKESIQNFSTSGYSNPTEIENTLSYKVLNQEKPSYLNIEEWELLLEKAVKQLEEDYGKAIYTVWFENMIRYFTVKKPLHFPESKWSEIVNKINREYLSRKKYDSAMFEINEFKKELIAEMPKGMLHSYWTDYVTSLKGQYYKALLREVYSSSSKFPLKLVENYNLDMLDYEKKETILNTAYRIELGNLASSINEANAEDFVTSGKLTWLRDDDYRNILNRAKKIIEIDKLKKKYEQLLEEVKKKSDELEKEEKNVIELKQKIERQLKIIHEFISDPTVVNRIEEYNNVFAPGNFENLKRLAHYIKDKKVKQAM